MTDYFQNIPQVKYEGPESQNSLAFRWYDKNRVVLGRSMAEQLRFAVCYWHNLAWEGGDPFGGSTFQRPWSGAGDPLALAELKAEAAFELFTRLDAPFYCFHDRDVAPEGATPRESARFFEHMVDKLAAHQQRTGVRLLWGTANLFGHRRYMAGAASNPDPAIFGMAAFQVRAALEATQKLGGENYVLWGGREGYETLLNTDLKREQDQLGRFLAMVIEHKHRIGFKGLILIEPKPREPTKHQYDFDVATVYSFLRHYGLEHEVKVNIESNHATLAGHSFEHEIALAQTLGIFGSIDMNRGDPLLGWDTDQFPNNVQDTALAMYHIFNHGGFSTGGINFDAKVRRQSIDAEDLVLAHAGAMDVCARALLIAERMIQDGALQAAVDQRYAGWDSEAAKKILGGKTGLAELADSVLERNTDPLPVSGKQEWFENLFNRYF